MRKRRKKRYANYFSNRAMRRKDPNIKKIRNGQVIERKDGKDIKPQ